MRLLRVILLALVVYAALVTAANPDPSTMTADEAHKEAMRHAMANDVNSAIPYFRQAADKMPHSPVFRNNLGVALMRSSKYAESKAEFLHALRLDFNHVDARDNLKELHGLWPEMEIDPVSSRVLGVPQTHGSVDISAHGGVALPHATRPNPLDVEDDDDAAFDRLTRGAGAAAGDDWDDEDENGNKVGAAAVARRHGAAAPSPAPARASASVAAPSAASAAAPCPTTTSPPLPGKLRDLGTNSELESLISTHWHPAGVAKFSRRNTNPRPRLPQLTVADLDKPENRVFRLGRLPFVLIPGPGRGPFVRTSQNGHSGNSWRPEDFGDRFARSIGDFYPVNMGNADTKPYLTPLSDAVRELYNPSGSYPVENAEFPGRYIQWNIKADEWDAVSEDADVPPMFKEDRQWMNECLRGAGATPADGKRLEEEFTTKLHWRMIVMGSEGAGMFNHYDVLPTASFQVQVHGAKRWHICAPDQRTFLYGVRNGVDAFYPDYSRHPMFAHARCWEDVVQAGQIVFYPKSFWHQTENQVLPSVAYSSSILHAASYKAIIEEFKQVCAVNKFNWNLGKELCAALQDRCFPVWERMYGPQGTLANAPQAAAQEEV